MIWSEWGKKKVSAFAFEPAGASFKIKDVIELVEPGDSGEFRPIDVALSYDGKTLYIADWEHGKLVGSAKTEKVGRVFAITFVRRRSADRDPSPRQRLRPDRGPIQAARPPLMERADEGRSGRSSGTGAGKPAAGSRPCAMLVDVSVSPIAKRHLVWVADGICLEGTPDARRAADRPPRPRRRTSAPRRSGPSASDGTRRPRPTALVAALGDTDPTVRLQAIIALGRIGESKAVPALLPILTDPDRYLAFSARQAIRRIGDWTAVASGLTTNDPKLRAAILATLELVYDPNAVALLRQVATEPKAPESERAKALGELALVHRKAPAWDGKWWGTRPTQGKPPAKTVAWEATPEIIKTIESSLSDPSAAVRLAAVSAVRETNDRDALPVLRERFQAEREPDVRREIALVLGSLGDKEALPLLVAALRDAANPESVRTAALTGLETIGGKPAVDALIEALSNPGESPKDETQVRMIAALGRFKAKPAIPAIEARLGHANPAIRVAAIESLGKIGDLKAVAPKIRPTIAQGRLGRRPQGRDRGPRRAQGSRLDPGADRFGQRRGDPLRGDHRPGETARRPGLAGLPPGHDRSEPRRPQGVGRRDRLDPRQGRAGPPAARRSS